MRSRKNELFLHENHQKHQISNLLKGLKTQLWSQFKKVLAKNNKIVYYISVTQWSISSAGRAPDS